MTRSPGLAIPAGTSAPIATTSPAHSKPTMVPCVRSAGPRALTLRRAVVSRFNPEVKQESYYRGDRWFGKFERTLPLPIPVQADKVTASYRDGVLTIKLPKNPQAKDKTRRIQIKSH